MDNEVSNTMHLAISIIALAALVTTLLPIVYYGRVILNDFEDNVAINLVGKQQDGELKELSTTGVHNMNSKSIERLIEQYDGLIVQNTTANAAFYADSIRMVDVDTEYLTNYLDISSIYDYSGKASRFRVKVYDCKNGQFIVFIQPILKTII